MKKRSLAILFATLVLGAVASPALADSNACAPGQQGNQDPGFKPPSCPH